MEFKISRTSMWGENKPCDNAYKKKIIKKDERGFQTFEEIKEKINVDWLSEGFNHKIIPANEYFKTQHIYREFNKEIWVIEINTLEDLLKLENNYGNLIIERAYENDEIYEIEIYDDWRE